MINVVSVPIYALQATASNEYYAHRIVASKQRIALAFHLFIDAFEQIEAKSTIHKWCTV